MKILSLDIETAPHTVHCWSLFKQTISLNQIMETGRVMCFAARWYGEKQIQFFSEHTNGHKKTILAAHKLLNEADAVLTYNGTSFDVPTLNKEFLKYGLPPPCPAHHIDLYPVVKRRFRFASNKLDHICQELGIGNKVRHEGHELWVKCMAGDKPAWKRMEKYNRHDVALLESLYQHVLPWIDRHPNSALYQGSLEDPTCTNCGSKTVHKRGIQTTRTHQYQRYRCDDCGMWMRSRYTLLKGSKVLTPIGA